MLKDWCNIYFSKRQRRYFIAIHAKVSPLTVFCCVVILSVMNRSPFKIVIKYLLLAQVSNAAKFNVSKRDYE